MPEAVLTKAVLLTLALLLCAVGTACLALAMDVHWQQVHTAPPRRGVARWLRLLGAGALLAALLLCLRADHASMAALVWVMALATSALVVAFMLSWRPRLLAWLVAWLR